MDYRELPERLDRKVIYESDYVCLYADKVKLSNGYIIEKYHQIHYPHEAISIVIFWFYGGSVDERNNCVWDVIW